MCVGSGELREVCAGRGGVDGEADRVFGDEEEMIVDRGRQWLSVSWTWTRPTTTRSLGPLPSGRNDAEEGGGCLACLHFVVCGECDVSK